MLLASLALAADAPTFSVERGVFDAPFSLELSGEGAIYYSTDGSTPSLDYTGALAIDGTTLVRAMSVVDGETSEIVTHTFLFPADVVAQASMDAAVTGDPTYGPIVLQTLAELPSVSIVAPAALSTTEQAVSAEYIDPDGDDLHVNCGAALSGTTSLGYPKNSVRLYFRSDYGASNVEYDFWPLDDEGVAPSREQDALSLRAGHDSVFYLGAQGQYTRNPWMDASQLAMGHLAPHVGFGHLYINGQYNGLYYVRERFGAAFLSHYMGGDEDDYEAVNEGTVMQGSGEAWSAVMAYAYDYENISLYMDVDDFIDYMILNFYAGNAWDWYYWHNWMAAGPSEAESGGYRFYSSDSDICLYYDWTVDITDQPGPSQLFATLLVEGHPDFMVKLADSIHRNLEANGPLTPERAGERYSWIAGMIEEAVVAESARWGYGWWDRDDEWVTERDRLLYEFFPYRTDEVLRQCESQGWYPVPAPTLSLASGTVTAGSTVTLSAPFGQSIVYTVDGTDPRDPGGALSASAVESDEAVAIPLPASRVVSARLREGDTWGPIEVGTYVVEGPVPLVLNEWNAVEDGEYLDTRDFEGSGSDDALGRAPGNGGAWIELVATTDVALAGWRFELRDLRGHAGTIELTADMPPLRAGSILTISADLPEDVSVDPDAGDWRLQLRATPSGSYARSDGFRVTPHEWQLRAFDADGFLRIDRVGEGLSPRRGIGAHEVGALLANPTSNLSETSEDYGASTRSTYAAPNRWEGGEQDLSTLRGEGNGIVELDDGDEPAVTIAGGEDCGCGTGGAPLWLGLVGLLLSACARGGQTVTRRDSGEPDTGSAASPEVCNGIDDDGDGEVDEDPVDGLPFYADADGDGHGDESTLVSACTAGEGTSVLPGDCDDADAEKYPGAPEGCGTVDYDCDGLASEESGADPACPAASCAAIYAELGAVADGPRWITLPSGAVAELYCDMSDGGWMLAFARNTASTGNQGDFGAAETAIEGLSISPEEASSSASAVLSWLDIEALDFTELRLTAAYSGSRTYTSRTIPRSELRIQFGEPGYFLYGGSTGYYWCGGPASYTDSGGGAVNNPDGAPLDCKGHGSLGSGWDFSESAYANQGLTLCGGDGSYWLYAGWMQNLVYYGSVGGAQAIWVR